MSEMIDRVARTILSRISGGLQAEFYVDGAMLARAAIEAMREPTEAND